MPVTFTSAPALYLKQARGTLSTKETSDIEEFEASLLDPAGIGQPYAADSVEYCSAKATIEGLVRIATNVVLAELDHADLANRNQTYADAVEAVEAADAELLNKRNQCNAAKVALDRASSAQRRLAEILRGTGPCFAGFSGSPFSGSMFVKELPDGTLAPIDA